MSIQTKAYLLLLATLLACPCFTWGQAPVQVYLSLLPSFEDMYVMASSMIIAETAIDQRGHFSFHLDFLPEGDHLYRLHLVKKGDAPTSLIIGGKDENHLFLIAHKTSDIHLKNHSAFPPFKEVSYDHAPENNALQQINYLVYLTDSAAANSSLTKRMLIEKKQQNDLRFIADTSSHILVSLFALYKSKFTFQDGANRSFYNSYFKARKGYKGNPYFDGLRKQAPSNPTVRLGIIGSLLALLCLILGFLLGRHNFSKKRKIDTLSVQERKIYELLLKGASNQEISDHFNIALSTVKTHVSNIYGKLKVKSRRELLNKD